MKPSRRLLAWSACLVAVLTVGTLRAPAQVGGDTNLVAPVVTIQAPDANANEGGDPGRLVILRGVTNGALTVWLQVSGTAMPGVDYQAISNTVVIPEGQRVVEISIRPLEDATPEPLESVVVRVVPSPMLSPVTPYLVGTPSVAQVNLADNDSNTASNLPPVVNLVQPSGGSRFPAGSSITLTADARDWDGSVARVEFFANQQSLGQGVRLTNAAGTVSSNTWALSWSNVPVGEYTLTARATDNGGASALSSGVRIAVGTNNQPPVVTLVQPTGGTRVPVGGQVNLLADARDWDGRVEGVEFFANQLSLGQGQQTVVVGGTTSNLWSLVWSNVPPGDYTLTARARDNGGASALSPGVRVYAGTNSLPPPPTNDAVMVTILASDSHAGEGLAWWTSNTVIGVNHEWWRTNNVGTNTATFVVRRSGPTNESLRVYYGIGGTASNGVDYETLPGLITIPAGRRAAEFRVMPLEDTLAERLETVVLRLQLPPLPLDAADRPYALGRPAQAAAFIVDNDTPPPWLAPLPGGLFHAGSPITNGCFRVEATTNLLDWEIICTNRVADGMARHIDAEGTNLVRRFFRLVPVECPAE
ncbi:MAG: hypothetical protein RJA22_1498 [Verrucomicrobiota bacterium]